MFDMVNYGKVKVDVEELKMKGEDAWKKIKQYKEALEQITTVVEGGNSYWKGQAADMYREVLRKQMQTADEALKAYEEYPKELLDYAGIYSNTIMATEELAESISDLKLF